MDEKTHTGTHTYIYIYICIYHYISYICQWVPSGKRISNFGPCPVRHEPSVQVSPPEMITSHGPSSLWKHKFTWSFTCLFLCLWAMDTCMAYGTWWASINSTIGYLCCKQVPAFSFPAVWTFREGFQSESWYAIPINSAPIPPCQFSRYVMSTSTFCYLFNVDPLDSRLTPLIGLAKEDLPLTCLLIIDKVVILRGGCFLCSAIWVPQIVSM